MQGETSTFQEKLTLLFFYYILQQTNTCSLSLKMWNPKQIYLHLLKIHPIKKKPQLFYFLLKQTSKILRSYYLH